jgi:hypothetical protein
VDEGGEVEEGGTVERKLIVDELIRGVGIGALLDAG